MPSTPTRSDKGTSNSTLPSKHQSLQISLPMYLVPGTQAHWQALAEDILTHISQNTSFKRDQLTYLSNPPADFTKHWRSADTLLSQTCTYPLLTQLLEDVTPIGTWIYAHDLANDTVGEYRSKIIAPRDSQVRPDAPDARFVFNNTDSLSGQLQLQRWRVSLGLAPRLPSAQSLSGSHVNSARLIGDRRADFAAIDQVTYDLLQRYQPDLLEKIQVIADSPSAPALPLVINNTHLQHKPDITEAIQAAIKHSAAATALGIVGFLQTTQADYLPFLAEIQNPAYQQALISP